MYCQKETGAINWIRIYNRQITSHVYKPLPHAANDMFYVYTVYLWFVLQISAEAQSITHVR